VKPSQRIRYADRIEKVVDYLSAELRAAEIPDLSRLAQIAGMSQYHFHRIFRVMTGETPIAMVRRLRLAAGTGALTVDLSVAEAAGKAGYGTSQSFARAFRSDLGTSATGARDGGSLAALQRHLQKPQRAEERTSLPPLSIEVISLEPFTVTALRNVGDYVELNLGFARLFSLLPDANAVSGLYGIPYDDPLATAVADCRFDCCVVLAPGVQAKHPDLHSVTIEAGRYARAHHFGPYEHCWSNLDRLYASLIEDLDAEIGEPPPFIHYHDDPDIVPAAALRADLFVPVEDTDL
jgi:AraC family transcriptional regulator